MRLSLKPLDAKQYQKSILIATILLSIIILTGAGVRLSEAGLGCEDWPICDEDKIIPGNDDLHGWIEFGNRLISGAVGIIVIVNIGNAYRRTPRSASVQRWAWGLVAGVVAQILLGRFTVVLTLHPAVVGLHFLLSLVLLWNCVALWHKNRPIVTHETLPTNTRTSLATHMRLLVAAITIVVCTGVLVTGTGPNSGDSRASRLPFDLQWVVRIHGAAVWTFLALLLWFAFRSRQHSFITKKTYIVMAFAIAQGAVGYTQYFLGVPPTIVAVHIAGSIAVWITTLDLYFHILQPKSTRKLDG